MGEKSGGLTNMVLGLIATVVIGGFIHNFFPDISTAIGDQLTSIVSNAGSNMNLFN